MNECTEKTKYKSLKSAKQHIKQYPRRMRIYLCPICHFYHTTKTPKAKASRHFGN
jgi:hypothetical protein